MEFIKCDIAITGGGASGLMTALTLAKLGVKGKIIIAERNAKIGRKLLATGNGRCNLSSVKISDRFYFGTAAEYAKDIFRKYDCNYIRKYFEEVGLLTVSDSEGRIYPLSNSAASVADCMRNYILSYGVTELCSTEVTDIIPDKRGVSLICECKSDGNECSTKLKISAKYAVLSCGGKASPKLSGNGNIYGIVEKLGIDITPVFPSLTSVSCSEKLLHTVKGVRVKSRVSLYADGVLADSHDGELQFTENSLSGICIFQLSRLVNEYFVCRTVNRKKTGNIKICVDLLPEYDSESCRKLVMSRKELFGRYELEKFFDGFINKKLGIAVLKKAGITDFSRKTATLSKSETEKICRTLKGWEFIPSKPSDFENAQITAGGVSAKEINFDDMCSKKYRNIYINGELVDIDGSCGGYNLHWAWCSGIMAAESIAERMEKKYAETE